jgi:hypothetical protein
LFSTFWNIKAQTAQPTSRRRIKREKRKQKVKTKFAQKKMLLGGKMFSSLTAILKFD